jgi:hypothetical protein
MNFEQNPSRGRLSTGSVSAIWSHWKFVKFMGKPRYEGMPKLQDQLFDIAADPQEHLNLAASYPKLVAVLSGEIDHQLALHGAETGG